ncbi:DUF4190 domain-containing protein [Streptomyces albidus (ex Kaewkla and Franco 2022)]|uniref:DUF4190 domain-containing protein n=1 Tax=Streptomyces albidus (ex Kaewkla and Franco 2022) TaxID=722709 RepID=UPI0015EFBA0E|nr:DUF4190 domain-containing protein [Streptomyces albidus (ex Kaewkla and Franco 2022)]
MADDTGQHGPSGDEPNPWAPPDDGVSLGKGRKGSGPGGQDDERRSVADQPTIASGSAAAPPPVPPAPGVAPGGPGGGPAAGPGASGFGQPQGPYGAQPPGPGHGFGGQPYGGQQYGAQPYGQPGPGAAYGYPTQAPGSFGYGAGPGGYGWHGAPLPNGKSVAAMVLGIISMVVVASCWGSFLGIITSPIALGLGLSARRGVERGELGGRGQAVAGFVMGIVGTVLSAIIVTVLLLMFTVFEDDLRESDPGDGGGGSSIDARGGVTLVVDSIADSGA